MAHHPVRPSAGVFFDPYAHGRAEAAYNATFAKWQAEIDAVMLDKSLSPEQRDAALYSLRIRQQAESTAARHRIVEEEKQRVRAAKRATRARLNDPPKPT